MRRIVMSYRRAEGVDKSVTTLIEVPHDTRFITVLLTYKDGIRCAIQRFARQIHVYLSASGPLGTNTGVS